MMYIDRKIFQFGKIAAKGTQKKNEIINPTYT